MLLDEALSGFKTNISPWQNPSGWIQADTEYINSIIQEIVTLTKRREIEQANFDGQDMIYPVCFFAPSFQTHSDLSTASSVLFSTFLFI